MSAGEASGDVYGAAFIRELRILDPSRDLDFECVGGKLLTGEGAELVCDSSSWGAVGITQALRQLPVVLAAFFRIRRHLLRGKPGLFVPIDFGFVNIRLCRVAKAAGWHVLYFIPPGSWRRNRQGRDLPSVTDAITTPFRWSAEILNSMGAKAFWYGHPIKQVVGKVGRLGEPSNLLAILPGSRKHEISHNLPLIAEAFRNRSEALTFIVAPSVDVDSLRRNWQRLAPGKLAEFAVGDKYTVLQIAKAAVVCSGTATLETALCGCPMVVLYKVSPLMHLQGYLMGLKKARRFSLPNILLQRDIIPELTGWNVTASDLTNALENVLADPSRQIEGFEELRATLGGDQAITETAKLAREFLR